MTQPRHGAGGEQRGDSTRTGDATGERGGGAKAAEAEAAAGAGEAGEVAAAAEAEGEVAAAAEEEEAEAVATFERCLVPCCREAEVWLVLSRAPTLSLTQP